MNELIEAAAKALLALIKSAAEQGDATGAKDAAKAYRELIGA